MPRPKSVRSSLHANQLQPVRASHGTYSNYSTDMKSHSKASFGPLLGVHPLDVFLQLDVFNAPLSTTADLDAFEIAVSQ